MQGSGFEPWTPQKNKDHFGKITGIKKK